MARGFAKRLNASLAIIDKRRPTANVAEVLHVIGDVEGRDCIIADDMIDTAGTMTEAVSALKARGARNVYCCATHALLSGSPAIEAGDSGGTNVDQRGLVRPVDSPARTHLRCSVKGSSPTRFNPATVVKASE